MDFTSIPIVCSARIADSRPAPGPFTRTSTLRMPNAFAALPAAIAACVAANGVPLRDPLKPMPPALDQATTLPSGSVMVMIVLLKEAWMCANPWCTIRFSPRFLNAFFLTGLPAFFFSPPPSGGADASIGSFFAINQFPVSSFQLPARMAALPLGAGDWQLAAELNRLLLRDRALARALPGARVGLRALAPHREVAAVAQPAVAADFHQALDVHGDLLAKVSFDAPLLFDHPADLPDVVFRQILHADVRADPGLLEDGVRPDAPDAVDVGEPDFDALGAREVDACDTCHGSDPRSSQLSAISYSVISYSALSAGLPADS